MILVDSSVWIDFFENISNVSTNRLAKCLQDDKVTVGVADLVVFEVMRGFHQAADQTRAKDMLLGLEFMEIGGLENALVAAQHYRELRLPGHTVRNPIDVLLASYCITQGHFLLHRDADFNLLETLRGLKVWRH